jgi:hypothetical protein
MKAKMQRVVLFIVFLLAVSCSSDHGNKESASHKDRQVGSDNFLPEIKFVRTLHDFGKIYQGEVVGTNFAFTNTGSANLIILDASASCGCTVPSWSKEPVPPGGTGNIEVKFDSAGREGKQNKSITIRTNAGDVSSILYITVEVILK